VQSDGLQEGKWIDANTRLILINFNVYSAALNRFGVVRLSVEFPASGKVHADIANLHTVKAFRYVIQLASSN
jgi:hypothetical protein